MILVPAAVAVLALAAGSATAQSAVPAYAASAVADAGRPQTDKDRDVHRKPAEMVVFGEIKPGSKVGELIPGGGYFTRVFSKVVGPTGHVYAVVAPSRPPAEGAPAQPARPVAAETIAADPAYANVTVLRQPYASWTAPTPLDVVWTSQNYHDMRNAPGADMLPINKAVFNALKPGGIYIVLDHTAPAGSTDTSLHRIDPALVKADVLAAGFEFVGESDVLRNPNDNKTTRVFDSSIRGDTDQFIYKFRKPGPK
jgi:predicted methyltransferase